MGDVLGRMPLPGDLAAGPMHRVPALQWRTWLRLAFVEAGSDWRSLQRLRVQDGVLADFGIIPERVWQDGSLGVLPWDGPSGVVTGKAGVTTGRFSVADPRSVEPLRGGALGVIGMDSPAGTVTSRGFPLNGRFCVADPRWVGREYGQYGVRRWDEPTGAVSSQSMPGGGRYAVADPRMTESRNRHYNLYRVIGFGDPATCITGASHSANGRLSVADPRPGGSRLDRSSYKSSGEYGVVSWEAPSGAIRAAGQHDNSRCSVADPRVDDVAAMPAPDARLVALIRALDDTWHRPFTTLELAALQGLVDPEEHLELDGLSDSAWRERIGNAVPPPAAQAIAGVMGQTLLLTWSGETFFMGNTPIWVRPVAAALMAATGEEARR